MIKIWAKINFKPPFTRVMMLRWNNWQTLLSSYKDKLAPINRNWWQWNLSKLLMKINYQWRNSSKKLNLISNRNLISKVTRLQLQMPCTGKLIKTTWQTSKRIGNTSGKRRLRSSRSSMKKFWVWRTLLEVLRTRSMVLTRKRNLISISCMIWPKSSKTMQ